MLRAAEALVSTVIQAQWRQRAARTMGHCQTLDKLLAFACMQLAGRDIAALLIIQEHCLTCDLHSVC